MKHQVLRQRRSLLTAILFMVAALPVASAQAAGVMLPGGEPDPACGDLRLWLRADSGIEDSAQRAPSDANFSGEVAVWKDRSTKKYSLRAPPGRAPGYVARQASAGGQPMVAFWGRQALARSRTTLLDRGGATIVLVLQAQGGGGAYGVNTGQNARHTLSLAPASAENLSLSGLRWVFPAGDGERDFNLAVPPGADGRTSRRLGIIVFQADGERVAGEFHDAVADIPGRAAMPKLQMEKCVFGFCLGVESVESPESGLQGQVAEVLVYNRGLTDAERRNLLAYLRQRYQLDVMDVLFPSGTLLLEAEDFDGAWEQGADGQCLGGRYVSAEGPAADQGIKTTVAVPKKGEYYVWVRAREAGTETSPPNRRTAIRTLVGGKPLAVTHALAHTGIRWRPAGKIELSPGPVEIVVRGEGPGRKLCDAVLLSPTISDPDAISDVCVILDRLRRAGGSSPITALFDNGLRLEGSLGGGWRWLGPAGPAAPPDPLARPALMCLQFDGRRPEPLAAGEVIVELRNGDRLRGAIAGYVPATPRASQPAQLLVRPSPELRSPKETVAIEMDWVRRVVFDVSPHRRPCAPGAVLGRDGRSHTYQALRWSADALTLLTEEGVERIPLTELAEVRMANADPWDWYCRELWDLDPQGKSPLFRMETADGSSLTTSLRRATQNRNDAGPVATQRTLQPVWAAGPISVPWSFTCRLWQAPPHVVPLSRIAPERVDQRTVLGGPWSWQAERNVLGGPLHSGGLDALWGLGVHARNALAFPLPDSARLFRANVGIDAAADGAGCVVAKVYVTQPASQLLFESKPLVGGGPTAYTGQLALGGGAGRHLVLVAESAGPLRPEGGEPLDIGDHLDWLEPTLVLDPAALWEEVAKRRAAGR